MSWPASADVPDARFVKEVGKLASRLEILESDFVTKDLGGKVCAVTADLERVLSELTARLEDDYTDHQGESDTVSYAVQYVAGYDDRTRTILRVLTRLYSPDGPNDGSILYGFALTRIREDAYDFWVDPEE